MLTGPLQMTIFFIINIFNLCIRYIVPEYDFSIKTIESFSKFEIDMPYFQPAGKALPDRGRAF